MAKREDLRLLLVDDDPDMARLVDVVLRQHGFQPLRHVTTGREALEAADEADIILLDQNLPDTSGLDLLTTLRTRPAPPAVVVITAHGTESLVATALRRGADDYLAKDSSLAELLPQVIERVRRNRALRAALSAAERDLVHAERLAAIGEMTVTLHHEINNPLMAASAELELLLGDAAVGPAQRTGLEAIRRSLARIRDILKRSRELQDAKSVEYLTGVRMIALDYDHVKPAEHHGTAVMYIPDEDLARVTALLLRHTGFRIQRVRTLDDLHRWANALGVNVVVVAGDATASSEHPIGAFRPDPHRTYTLVALVTGSGDEARAAGADHVVPLPFDPGTFGADLVAVLRR